MQTKQDKIRQKENKPLCVANFDEKKKLLRTVFFLCLYGQNDKQNQEHQKNI